jgi:replicative DNA helicase
MEPNSSNSSVTPLHATDDDGSGGYRTPPHNMEAEQALLGAILVNNRAHERVSEFLRPEHFFDPLHGRVFEAVATLVARGQIANPVTLKTSFDQDEAFAELGGAGYLARLAGSAVTVLNAHDYGRTIHDLYLRRQLIELGEETVNASYAPDLEHTATEQIEEAERKLYELATSGDYDGGFQDFSTALASALNMAEAAHKRDGKLVGTATGFTDLDNLLGGLHPSDLIVLAGRPSMGKTALATNIAFNAARAYRTERDEDGNEKMVDGAVVGFFSLEMSAEQLATRILAEESGVASDSIRRGVKSSTEFEKIVLAVQALQKAPLFIDDTPALSVSALRTRARRLQRMHGLSLIVVDYLQLLTTGTTSRQDNRVQEVSEITRGLKTLAKELNVPVLALSQLSRQVEARDDKRPQLSDLRESGSIEQDSDVVMFIFREEYYLARKEPRENTPEYAQWQEEMEKVHNLADINIAKQRHGPIGIVRMQFESRFTRFSDLVRADHLPEETSF